MRTRRIVASTLAGVALTAASLAVAPAADAQLGGGGVRTESVRGASGFGGGTIYMPSGTGNRGAVVIAPGFTAGSGSYRSIAQDMARQGFVAFAIDTNSRSDQPDSRGRQLKAATDHLLQRSGARTMIDANKVGVAGHSMGGGGTLRAANDNPSTYKAAVPLQPWHGTKSWSRLQVPTLIIGAQRDSIASDSSHSTRFFRSIPSSTPKGYIQLSGASHMVASSGNRQQTAYMAAWLKRFLLGDTSQDALLCGNDRSGLSAKEISCPLPAGNPTPTPTTTPTPGNPTPTTTPTPTPTTPPSSCNASSVRTESVRGASGFGGGTIYMPAGCTNVGAVVIAPGFTAGSGSYRSIAQAMAREGFVAFAIDTNSRMDQPDSRGRQLKAATDHLLQRSGARSMVNPNRVGVAGHSMGGGGTLRAANDNPSTYKAAVPLQPWHGTKSWSRLQVPTMIIGAQRDTIASTSSHSERFYSSIPASTEKAYIELSGASHMVASSGNRQQTAYMAAWLKRFLNGDTSQDAFLCGNDRSGLSAKEITCPLSGGNTGGGGTPTPGTPSPGGGFGSGGGLFGGGSGGFDFGGLFGGGGGLFGGLFGGGLFG